MAEAKVGIEIGGGGGGGGPFRKAPICARCGQEATEMASFGYFSWLGTVRGQGVWVWRLCGDCRAYVVRAIDAAIACSELDARRDAVGTRREAGTSVIDAFELVGDAASVVISESPEGMRRSAGLSEDRVKGEEIDKVKDEGLINPQGLPPKSPPITESRSDSDTNAKNIICGCPESCAVPSESCMRPRGSA